MIAENYLKVKKREYTDISPAEKVSYWENRQLLYGEHEGKKMNVFSVGYGYTWGNEIKSAFIIIAAESREVLYSINPHGCIEDLEE